MTTETTDSTSTEDSVDQCLFLGVGGTLDHDDLAEARKLIAHSAPYSPYTFRDELDLLLAELERARASVTVATMAVEQQASEGSDEIAKLLRFGVDERITHVMMCISLLVRDTPVLNPEE